MAKRTHTAHLNNVQINSSLNYIRVCFNLLPILCVCVFKCVCLCIKWLQSCSTLSDPVGCSLPGSSVHGILQARILEWAAVSFSRDLFNPGNKPRSPTFPADCLLVELLRNLPEHPKISILQFSSVAQPCPTLCDPVDWSLPGSSVHEILQARILEWVAISFSRGSCYPCDRTQVSWIVDRFFTFWDTREIHIYIYIYNIIDYI